MKCIKCGKNLAAEYCNVCGFDNKHIAKALNTADYYYNLGLEKAQMRDLSGAEILLLKALSYNKEHKNARNLLGLVYQEMGEGGKAYRQWKISLKISPVEENAASLYVKEMEEHPAIFEQINESSKKFNLALSYAKQGSDDLAMIQIKKVLSITPNFVRGHILFALLHMRAQNMEAAKTDLKHALAIDQYNTTARRYLKELGEDAQAAVAVVTTESMRPDNDNLKNVRPVDHYEDPNKETWKQFVYMIIGLAIGVIAMFVLVIPSVRAGVSVDYKALQKEYTQMENEKDSEISELKNKNKSLEDENGDLKNSLSVYEATNGKDSMYDSMLKASKAFYQNDYIECSKHLSKVSKGDLPSNTSRKMYDEMSEKAFESAGSDLKNSGVAQYNSYKYAESLKDLEDSYKYKQDYDTLYYIGMCKKQLGRTDEAKEDFYEIINECGNNELIIKTANYGLELLKEDAINEAKKHKNDANTTEESTDSSVEE